MVLYLSPLVEIPGAFFRIIFLYRFFVKLRQTLSSSYLGALGALGGSLKKIKRIFIQNWYYRHFNAIFKTLENLISM